jgi:hypothetical protein
LAVKIGNFRCRIGLRREATPGCRFGIRLALHHHCFVQPVRHSLSGSSHKEDDRMSRRSSGRSFVGLILEVGLIVAVVAFLPKLNLRPQSADANSPPVAQVLQSPALPAVPAWWQAEPSARATSWRESEAEPIHVEQTLENASRRLLSGAADIAGRAAADLIAPPSEPPIESQPLEWRRY